MKFPDARAVPYKCSSIEICPYSVPMHCVVVLNRAPLVASLRGWPAIKVTAFVRLVRFTLPPDRVTSGSKVLALKGMAACCFISPVVWSLCYMLKAFVLSCRATDLVPLAPVHVCVCVTSSRFSGCLLWLLVLSLPSSSGMCVCVRVCR